MTGYHDEIMEDVRQRKAEINREYPTFEALHAHIAEEEVRLKSEGWKFVDIDELRARNYRRQMTESL
jgi:hypothetical protein